MLQVLATPPNRRRHRFPRQMCGVESPSILFSLIRRPQSPPRHGCRRLQEAPSGSTHLCDLRPPRTALTQRASKAAPER
uniref:Uncharacterized protein n=1 Tax=Setaria italica TaxID=4555 RepID=K4AHH3_SETIT